MKSGPLLDGAQSLGHVLGSGSLAGQLLDRGGGDFTGNVPD